MFRELAEHPEMTLLILLIQNMKVVDVQITERD